MSGRDKKVKGPLLGACFVLCIASAGLFTSSAFSPQEKGDSWTVSEESTGVGSIDLFAALFGGGSSVKSSEEEEKEEEKAKAKEEAEKDEQEAAEEEKEEAEEKKEKKKATPTPTPRPAKVKSSLPVSEVAADGVWVSDGHGGWIFMIEGGTVPYSGWLTDVDGKTYYLGDDYLMITGWLEEDGKTYYFDEDGIMQVGEVVVDGEDYTFGDDGILVMVTDLVEEEEEKEAKAEETEKAEEEKTKKAKKESQGALALTFDDGPSDFTPDLLACLEKYGAHATFFMVGKEIEARPEIPAQMLSLGMELGNHTWAHSDLTTLEPGQILEAIGAVDSLLVSLTGQASTVVRPPYGAVNDTVKNNVAAPLILWSVDTLDWDTQDVKSTVKEIKKEAKDGAIILMHDYYETTMQACLEVVPWLIDEGYELLTIHELAERKGVVLNNGEAYTEIF